MRSLWKRRPVLSAGISGVLLALAFVLLTSTSSNAGRCPPPDPNGKDDTGLYCLENFDLLANRSNIGTDNNSTSPYMASANFSVNSPNQPVAGLLVYGDYVALEIKARELLSNTLKFREDISPYQGKKNFDDLVRQFDQASDFASTYYPPGQTNATMLNRINKADTDLREARNLYAFLAVYAPRNVMRQDSAYKSELCALPDNFLPPSKTDTTPGAVGPPIRDWCNFEARLSETVREAGNIRMIFGQQSMVAALGVGFSRSTWRSARSMLPTRSHRRKTLSLASPRSISGRSVTFGC